MSRASVVIVPYRSFGTRDSLHVRGRVLHDRLPDAATTEQSIWHNLRDALRRIESDEARGVAVEVTCGAQAVQTVTDQEGYFEVSLARADTDDAAGDWRPVLLSVRDADTGEVLAQTTADVLTPPRSARFGIISDIDDTILQTQATSLVRSAWVTLLQNAATRLPFPGVATLYQALQAGITGCEGNPIFYVSSSPWNLYDFLVEFMQVRAIPAGPVFLRDYGIDMMAKALSHDHKLEAMRRVLDTYPDLPFVLLGDSGQKDPELYSRLADAYPGRVLAIYIRDVSGEKRDAAVDAMAEKLRMQGVLLVRVADSLAVAQSAAAMGLIAADTVETVRESMHKEETISGA